MKITLYRTSALRYARARVIAGLLALCGAAPVWAVPSINISTSFEAADGARTYMDSGGVWDGGVEVTDTDGDTFVITIENDADGAPNPLVNDVAFDIDLTLNVPSGFRLPDSPFNVTTSASGGGANCVAPAGVTAQQAGGPGTPVNFDFPANTNLPGQSCRYRLSFGLTTSDVAPFVGTGTHTLNYRFRYNEIDGSVASQETVTESQNIAVRRGDVIVTKTAVPNPADTDGAYADGETARWTVSVFNNGTGGAFEVAITDILSANFDTGTLVLTPPASPPGTLVSPNVYTFDYLEPGQQVDITVEAEVSVPGGTSCPDLRNDVEAEDRLGNDSEAFASVEFDLQDPLLEYDPDDFVIDFGSPTTVDFPVENIGTGPARNVRLRVFGLTGVAITTLSAEWDYNPATFTFIHVGADGNPNSGDEIIPAGGSSLLEFSAEMNTCGGPDSSILTWNPAYENICGLDFTPPVRSSTYIVNNFPNVTIDKSVSPDDETNFGVPMTYTISLAGSNITELTASAGADWRVTDQLPVGVSGTLQSVPAGTTVTVGGSPVVPGVTVLNGGDTITWTGENAALSPAPSLIIDFTVDSCPTPALSPPYSFSNTASLQHLGCNFTRIDSVSLVVNDSPINMALQVFELDSALSPPFEAGRPDTNLTAAPDEVNEGERIVFRATYPFPDGYGGEWAGSAFTADMGSDELAGAPLQLAFDDNNSNGVFDAGDIAGFTVEVINNNAGGTSYPRTAVGSTPTAGVLVINGDGSITIPDLDFIRDAIGDNSMSDMELIIEYIVTAPEGTLDPDLQPTNDDDGDANIGIFTERVTLTVENSPDTSCASNNSFTQGVSVALERADVMIAFADVEATNDAGACGIAYANLGVESLVGLQADNIRIRLESPDYTFVDLNDFTFGGAGNLGALNPTITAIPQGVDIEVTPNDTANLLDLSTIRFPVSLNPAATGRVLEATVFFDSNHTSPEFGAVEDDEDYPNGPVSFSIPTPDADLNVSFFPANVVLGNPTVLDDVDGNGTDEGIFTWRARITNTGTTTVTDYVFTNEVPADFLPYGAGSDPVADSVTGQLMVWNLPDLDPGEFFEITVAIGLPQNAGCSVGSNESSVRSGCAIGSELPGFPVSGPDIVFPTIDLELDHDSSSFCELCGEGYVDLIVRNEGASDLYNLTVSEDLDLLNSGLEYAGRTEVFPEGAASYEIADADDPNAAGATDLSWNMTSIPELGRLYSDLSGTLPTELTIRFYVRTSSSLANPEELLTASREIRASAEFELFCGSDPSFMPVTADFTVPLHQPQPEVEKQGRNFSAGQDDSEYADEVFGGRDDVVIWRVDIENSGATDSADLQDLLVSDTIGGNFSLRYVCPSEAAAASMAGALQAALPVVPAAAFDCETYAAAFDADDPFGNPDADIDVAAGENIFIYYVGHIGNSCANETNNAAIAWGCEAAPPAGGINADGTGGNLNAGLAPGSDDDTAELNTTVDPDEVDVTQTVTGVNTAQPVGTKGIVTITIANNSGGTIRNLVLEDILPEDYQLDPEWFAAHPDCSDRLDLTTAFGEDYEGRIDTCEHVNIGDADGFTEPRFALTSSTQGTSNQSSLLRHGDQIELQLGIIRVRPFDDTAAPEIREENVATDTDPNYSGTYTNNLRLDFENTCGTLFTRNPAAEAVTVNPEDLDIDINEGEDLFFILTDPEATFQMDVVLRNRGGHDASDYSVYVTVGEGINVRSVNAGSGTCTLLTATERNDLFDAGTLPPPAWDPDTTNVYLCAGPDPLSPAASHIFGFEIERDMDDTTEDLTFRADVIGRTTQFDGNTTTLDPFNADGFPNYSLDNILVRLLGFTMSKTLQGCAEAASTDPLVMIGEECTYRIEAKWFGFANPGFSGVEIRNARIYEGSTANNPPAAAGDAPDALDGQGFVSLDVLPGSVAIDAQNPASPGALAETGFMWRLDTITPAPGDTEKSFIADLRLRTLNEALNTSAAPNVHADSRVDEVNARFEVVVGSETFIFDENTPGYPSEDSRQETLRIIEPELTLTKEVCNETLSIEDDAANSGANCTPFVTTTLDGDADHTFIYRLVVSNENTAGGVQRAPAFDVTINDAFDDSDLTAPADFSADNLDNDGDGLIDAADTDGEGTVDNAALNDADAADIIFSGSHSDALAQIDAGDTVTLLYRAGLDASVTSGQEFTNTADGGYDSLPGAAGAQSPPQGVSGEREGAREYEIPQAEATIRIGTVVVNTGVKEFINTSRRDAGLVTVPCAASPCVDENAVIGEEVRVRLEFTLPVSELRQLTVIDNLPTGMECIEAFPITLPTGSDPEFTPGGTFAAATCSATQVRWNLGNQELQGSDPAMEYTLQAEFIARVRNVATNNSATEIINGGDADGGGTDVSLRYRDAANILVRYQAEEATLTVQEPELLLTKTMTPGAPDLTADAIDTINVEVTIQNTGESAAYNIVLLDTLDPKLSFVAGSVGGANQPAEDLSVPATPRFTFTDPLLEGNSFTFTYQVRAAGDVQPLEVLSNTINARFTSLPANTVALNSGGTIGIDGDSNGMRIGFVPPGGDPVNDYEAEVTDGETVPALRLEKNDLEPGIVPTIGARKHFQLILHLPEGIAEDVVVRDNLGAGGASFVLENEAGFDITYSFPGIESINGTDVTTLATPAAVETALAGFDAADEATDIISWNFGTVETLTEDDAGSNGINPQIVIDYYARVANEPGTVAATGLQNAASVDYTDGETGTPAPTENAPPIGPFPVVEPELQVRKIYTDPLGTGTVIQGVAAEFEISVENVGGATAWDATIVDMLPNRTDAGEAGGMCDSAPTITAIEVNGRTLTAGTDYTATFTPPASVAALYCSYTIVLTPSTANDAARIEFGETLLIRYEATTDVGIPSNSSLTNVAGATRWFSLNTDGVSVPPEIRQYDRVLTLRPSPNPGTVGIDDWQDAVTVQTESPAVEVSKSVINLTTGQDPATTASPGDTLRYTITIRNTSAVDATGLRLTDDPDEVNAEDFSDGYFANSPAGTLRNVTIPAGAANNSLPSGGVTGSGLLDVSGIDVPAGGSVTVTFEIDVKGPDSPLPHALIRNIAHVELPGFADPIDSDPAETEIINTASGFLFEKVSRDLTGDPDVLEPGDTLRYTIRIKNRGDPESTTVGLMHAVNTRFRDQIPAHTTYVANSTRLNGERVPDRSRGVPPFVSGMAVNSPDVDRAGFMTANSNLLDNSNVATVSFEVTVNSGLVNGAVISNHALLTGREQAFDPFTPLPFPAELSDDPATVSVPDDPTQNVVGSGVNIDALKTVEVIDGGDEIPDTGETLRYTIVIINRGNIAATDVRLLDGIPAGTSYNPDSVSLNGQPVPDGAGDTSPLIAGIALSSDDLTPPLPDQGDGELSAGGTATVTFEVTITAASGSVINNQGTVRSDQQPDEPTDADGNDENGDQPTRLVVGGAAQLEIAKEVVVIGGGTVQPDGQLEYRIRVENTGNLAADNVVVRDTMPGPAEFIADTGRINGARAGISFSGRTLTADYSSVYGALAAGGSFVVTFRVNIDAEARAGDDIDNTATVNWTGGSATDSANIDVGGAPGLINLNGRVWDNRNHNRAFNSGEPQLRGWRVRVFINNPNPGSAAAPLAEAVTDDQGRYEFTGLAPVDPGDADGAYTITFSVPADAAAFPADSNIALGETVSAFGNEGLMIINNLNVPAGRNAQNESLPVDPTGIVYNSISRGAVPGARVTLLDRGGEPLPAACFSTPNHLDSQQGQITSALGFYRFDLNFSADGCPAGGADYVISVELPNSEGIFMRNVSTVIQPEGGVLDVQDCPDSANDRVPSPPANTCEVQRQATIPGSMIPPGLGTRYFLDVNLASGPEELFNNHLPVDVNLGAILSITKQTPLKNVVRGQLVPYTITVTNPQDFVVFALELRDFFPPGFKYVAGSAVIDGQPAEPLTDASTFNDDSLRAGTLSWSGLSVPPGRTLTLKLLLVVGAGVGEGEYTNQAQAFITGLPEPVSGRASATVRVVPDPTFDCSDIIGKVYDDRNANGYPDEGEPGIAGARVATAQGLLSTTDKYGRFHVTCAAIPNPDRGSNFILKLDERSLPSGYRVTTENPRVQRVTRGKVAKFNFGVTLHRVVRLDLADQAFEFGGTAIQEHWRFVLDDLLVQLREQPSILRITYLVENESEALAKQRLEVVQEWIAAHWKELKCCYDLKIESEIFWRTGSPE